MSGADQSASWGGSPVVRPAVSEYEEQRRTHSDDYTTLNGMNTAEESAADLDGVTIYRGDAPIAKLLAVVWPKRTPVGWRPMDWRLYGWR